MPDVLTLSGTAARQHEGLRAWLLRGRPARCRACIRSVGQRATTLASAIRITEPIHRAEVADALGSPPLRRDGRRRRDRCAPGVGSVATRALFCEPASAAGLAGSSAAPRSRASASSA